MKKLGMVTVAILSAGIIFSSSFAPVSAAGRNIGGIRDGVQTGEYIPPEPEYRYDLTDQERIELMRIAFAEAGNQGVYGQALIMQVVMNRVEDSRFPSSVHGVIFAPSQFAAGNRNYNNCPFNAEQYAALDMLLTEDVDEGRHLLYFSSGSGHSWATYVMTHGAHTFYTN